MDEDYAAARATLQNQLANVICHIRVARARMDAEAFDGYLSAIEMDEDAAQDFLDSDGTIEGMTARMWMYFESPLKPRLANAA